MVNVPLGWVVERGAEGHAARADAWQDEEVRTRGVGATPAGAVRHKAKPQTTTTSKQQGRSGRGARGIWRAACDWGGCGEASEILVYIWPQAGPSYS